MLLLSFVFCLTTTLAVNAADQSKSSTLSAKAIEDKLDGGLSV